MMFLEPIWLLLLFPAAMVWWVTRSRSPAVRVLRAAILVALVIAAAHPAMILDRPGGTVVAVIDRSDSMHPEAEGRMLESLQTVRQAMGPHDRLGVVTFGASPFVEQAPARRAPQRFEVAIDGSASNLGAALRSAMTLLEPGASGRLLLLTDGHATDTRTREAAAIAGTRDLAIDFRFLGRSTSGDVAIHALDIPSRVRHRDGFLISAWIDSPDRREVPYVLVRDNVAIARGTAALEPGRNRLTFRDLADSTGQQAYTFRLDVPESDPIPENNTARAFVGIEESASVLVVSATPGQGLARVLRASGLDVTAAEPRSVDWSLGALAGYSAFVIENVPIQDIGLTGAENLAALVRDRGAGLVMTGGWKSFGAGGYLGSPIDPVLPVSLELRTEFRKLRVSIVVALDRSGSMAAVVDGGRTKMQLAGLAAASTLDLLTPFDRFGAIAVDTEPHVIVPLSPVAEATSARAELRSLRSMGGGIYVYVALARAAAMIMDADPGAKHVILFADAADAEAPGDYRTLIAKMVDAGVTISVVGLGTEGDPDAELLRSIAALGNGRALFTADPKLLPQLFTQDAIAVARSAFLDTPTTVTRTGEMAALLAIDLGAMPKIGGYNPTTARPGASIAAFSEDEYRAPILVTWAAGLGRVAAYTGEADGSFTGEIASWDRLAEMWTGIVRSVLPAESNLGEHAMAVQSITGSVATIDLYIDPDSAGTIGRPAVRVLRKAPGQPPRTEVVRMALAAPDKFSAEITLAGDEVIVPTIELDNGRYDPMAAVILPISPEHTTPGAWSGERLLRDLASATGGVERTDLAAIWDDLPRSRRITMLTPLFFGLAIVLLVAEVFHRRIGFPTVFHMKRAGALQEKPRVLAALRSPARAPNLTHPRPPIDRGGARSAPGPGAGPAQAPDTRTAPPPSPPAGTVLDAMTEIKKRRD